MYAPSHKNQNIRELDRLSEASVLEIGCFQSEHKAKIAKSSWHFQMKIHQCRQGCVAIDCIKLDFVKCRQLAMSVVGWGEGEEGAEMTCR